MYRLMIVDDEEVILNALSTCIDWNALNIQVCALCHNAVESYEVMEDIYPDLVISDIQMPGYSSLDLIRWAQKSKLPTRFIILSGYSKFDYAQEAMLLGVKHYLLKPCNDDQLLAAVRAVCREIDTERSNIATVNETFYHKFQCQTINNILCECATAPTTFPTMQYAYKYIDFHYEPYCLVVIDNIPLRSVPEFLNLIYAYRDSHFPNTYLHLLHAQKKQILLCKAAALKLPALKTFLGGHFPQVSGTVLPSLIEALERIFEIAQKSVDTQIIYGHDLISLYNFSSSSLQQKQIAQDIFSDQSEIRQHALSEVLEFNRSYSDLNELKIQIVNFIVELDLIAPALNITDSAKTLIQKLKLSSDREMIFEETKMFLRNLSGSNAEDSGEYKPFIQKILDYVEENLGDPELTLKKIATTYLYMNVNYLGQQFQKEIGMKFSTYLSKKRIEAAKVYLLEAGKENIYLVAEKVGCGNNPQYFSQVFKKYTGMSPTRYISSHT